MCGKFTQMASWRDVVDFSQPLTEPGEAAGAAEDEVVLATPMRFANILRLDAAGRRELAPMRWGFAELGAANPGKPKHMHCRAETIDALPTFRESFALRRGILPVRTFNEGEEIGSKTRQWVITPKDRLPIAIAVIFEEWRNGEETLLTFVQVTTAANALIGAITDRMPAILPDAAAQAIWLGETPATLAEVKAVLTPYDDRGMWDMAPEQKPVQRKRPPRGETQPGLF